MKILAFMFESRYVIAPTKYALEGKERQPNYSDCWKTIKNTLKINDF